MLGACAVSLLLLAPLANARSFVQEERARGAKAA